jgi:leader peptidase (prepilin peptidase)/N-methyltransferase
MTGISVFIAAVFGLVFGSFLNVCIYRLPRDLSIVAPRSFCPSCQRQIRWYDNFPLLSYVLLAGRCRVCKAPIGWRYPIVEAMTAALFAGTIADFGLTTAALKWIVFGCMLVILFWTDAETRLLPDELTLGGIAVGLGFSLFVPLFDGPAALFAPRAGAIPVSLMNSAIAAFLLSVPFVVFSYAYTRLRGIIPPGWGDVKLLAMLGTFLGLGKGILAMMLGAIGGAILGGGYILIRKKDPRTHALPLGTFLSVGGVIAAFWGPRIIQWWQRLNG